MHDPARIPMAHCARRAGAGYMLYSACAACLLAGAAFGAFAQPYPTKPVRVIVPVAVGGGSDFVARLIGNKLTEALGQQVIVDNRPGGGASVGMEYGLRSPADGYTLTQITPTYTINPSVRQIKLDVNTDYTPIILEGKSPLALLVHPSLSATSMKALIALAKSRPDQINYGTSGEGTMVHLATELLLHMTGTSMAHVPYKGGAPALVDLIAGHIQLVLSPPQTGMPHARSGKLRALAMTTAERTRADPDVPTVAESGVPGYEATNWHALIGPKGMPRAVVERLNTEIRRIVVAKETESLLLANGIEPAGSTPDQLAAEVRRDFEQWRKVIKARNIRAE